MKLNYCKKRVYEATIRFLFLRGDGLVPSIFSTLFPMETKVFFKDEAFDIPLEEIKEKYAELRLIYPSLDESMYQSIKKYGQLSPVVVCREGNRYELLDGFKRLRAGRKLQGFKNLKAKALDVGVRAQKAAIVQLNWVGKSIGDIEEAMVIHSLYRDDCLTQLEIATLLGRHKSWVSRRISLVEQLGDEVKRHLRLGLVKVSICRELMKLPRGNQEAALLSVEKHGLTQRETEKFVCKLLCSSKYEQEAILKNPEEICQDKDNMNSQPRKDGWGLTPPASEFEQKLLSLEQCCLWVVKKVRANWFTSFTEKDFRELSPVMVRAICAVEQVINNLKDISGMELKVEKEEKNL